jgi:expansin (peptidoglycan-binding protein)
LLAVVLAVVAAGTVVAAARHQGDDSAGSRNPTILSDEAAVLAGPPSGTALMPSTVPTSDLPTPHPVATTHPPKKPKRSVPRAVPTKRSTTRTTSPAAGHAAPATGAIQIGKTYTGRGTFYAATGAGNCSYPASSDLMVGAMNQHDYENSQACGDYLAVTGPKGNTITIKVVDRCPECPPGAIDLSAQAFVRLAAPVTGEITIHWRLLSPALTGPIAFDYKSGSSRYWCGIQVRNHRNPVRSLAVLVNGNWKALPRMDYNYFVSASGAGCGSSIRVTDIYGNQLTDTGIGITPNAVQPGHAQFPAA